MGEGEGGVFQENSIETCILSRVKQITSPGWMHETSAQTWCTGKTQRDRVEREVGGGIRMGNTCKPMADSFQCMTKSTTIKKKKKEATPEQCHWWACRPQLQNSGPTTRTWCCNQDWTQTDKWKNKLTSQAKQSKNTSMPINRWIYDLWSLYTVECIPAC